MPRSAWALKLLLLLMIPCTILAQRTGTNWTVVIDAGHGGNDPGALGRFSKEKNINLAIALKLGNMIQRNMKDVKVVYTRDKDYFVELYRRAEIANDHKADLFISIHCNANRSKSLKGAETYVMGLHKSQANLDIAKLENASILLESDYQSTYGGFDPNSDESYITFSLNQNSNLDISTDFAALIQNQLADNAGMTDRGVRQAGFLVLWKTTMPSVLVEVGYISNSTEEKLLQSSKGQDYIASAIFRSFRDFREKHTARANSRGSGKTSAPSDNPPQSRGTERTNTSARNPLKGHGTDITNTSSGILTQEPGTQKTNTTSINPPDPVGYESKSTTRDRTKTGPVSNQRSTGVEVTPASASQQEKVTYRVQIAVSAEQLDSDSPKISGFPKVRMYLHQGMFKYTVGDEATLNEAEKLLKEVRQKGAKDAFIVVFRNNQRLPQDEAARFLEK